MEMNISNRRQMDISDFQYRVMADRSIIRTSIIFWLFENVGDCPVCPTRYRSLFGNSGLVKRTTDVTWRYGKWTSGEYYFRFSSDAVLFKLKWGK